jgi:hypothetical protein
VQLHAVNKFQPPVRSSPRLFPSCLPGIEVPPPPTVLCRWQRKRKEAAVVERRKSRGDRLLHEPHLPPPRTRSFAASTYTSTRTCGARDSLTSRKSRSRSAFPLSGRTLIERNSQLWHIYVIKCDSTSILAAIP